VKNKWNMNVYQPVTNVLSGIKPRKIPQTVDENSTISKQFWKLYPPKSKRSPSVYIITSDIRTNIWIICFLGNGKKIFSVSVKNNTSHIFSETLKTITCGDYKIMNLDNSAIYFVVYQCLKSLPACIPRACNLLLWHVDFYADWPFGLADFIFVKSPIILLYRGRVDTYFYVTTLSSGIRK